MVKKLKTEAEIVKLFNYPSYFLKRYAPFVIIVRNGKPVKLYDEALVEYWLSFEGGHDIYDAWRKNNKLK